MKKTGILALIIVLPLMAACGKKADLTRPDDQQRLSYPEGATPDPNRKD